MNKKQAAALGALRAVQLFVNDHQLDLPTAFPSGAKRLLDEIIEDLHRHSVNQEGGRMTSQGLTAKQQSLRLSLIRDHIVPIVKIIRLVGLTTPELVTLRTPRKDEGLQRLVDYATGIANAIEPHSAQFISMGQPVGFTARLREAVRELIDTVGERDSSAAAKVGATAGLADRLSRAARVVAVIDAFVERDLQHNPETRAAWRLVKHIPRTRKRTQSAPQPVTDPQRLLPRASVVVPSIAEDTPVSVRVTFT